MTVNLAWRTAMASTYCSAADYAAGFAPFLAHRVIAAIQRPYTPELVRTADQRIFGTPGYNKMMALCWQIEDDCKTGALPHTVRSTKPDGTDYMVSAQNFAAWLAAQGEEPSAHIRAWFDATGVAPTAAPTAPETKEDRQDRRLQACIDAGLPMEDTKAVLLRLPDGIGRVAQQFGVTRQAFTADVKAALKRRLAIEQGHGTVHRTR